MNDTTVRDDPAAPEPVGGSRPVREWALADLPALTFDPLLADVLSNEQVARVRMPFGQEREAWLVTRYQDVRLVTSDPRFSRSALVGREVNGMMAHRVAATVGLNYADPPDHTRLRKVMTKAFTGRTMKGLRPRAERTADALLDAMEEAGRPADLVAHLHGPFPLTVVSDLLGVPPEDRARLADWPDVILSAGPGPKSSEAAKERMRQYIVDLLTERRESPGDDLATVLGRACAAGEITDAEAVSLATAVLVSGAHAVRNNSANMVYTLLTRPELAERLRAEPELLPQAVDELLRHIPHRNGVGLPRIATEDVEVGGVLIREGEAVYASYLAANRDPDVFDEPGALDLDRTGTAHLSFGHGPHHCIGAMLARMESEVMLGALLTRFPGLRLAVGPDEVEWQSKGFIRGPKALPVTW
ncbi:cytochrome P450 [Streptomyces sp. VRA16 Mangrove soil]|uniref:cytochrome P450 n=1 Tax=Streptomyces sp. VRA16 Mangrove soil TaxID=2817434 RepID=UPI001A9EA92F|nr:cytochrome P450 [Streptomyces sp. VRA16 Mangrove soil]MBO1332926.1 cytochrome P450 [Streptomyces sp. VRA16 Mangrove soil]